MFVGWPSDTAERAARRCRRAWRNGQIGDGNLHTVGQTTSEALTRRMELRPDLKDDAGVRSVDDEPPATVGETNWLDEQLERCTVPRRRTNAGRRRASLRRDRVGDPGRGSARSDLSEFDRDLLAHNAASADHHEHVAERNRRRAAVRPINDPRRAVRRDDSERIRAARSRACNSGPCLNIVDDYLL